MNGEFDMKPLFETKTEYSFDEYKKFIYVIQNSIFKMKRTTIIYIVLMLALSVISFVSKNYFLAAIYIVCTFIIPAIFYTVNLFIIKKNFYSNKSLNEAVSVIKFYDKHLEMDNSYGHSQIEYDKLYKIIETKANFYLLISRNQGISVIKYNCQPELIEFLRMHKQTYGQV